MKWVSITKEEFDKLKKLSVKSHSVKISTPPIYFYWDENGAKHNDLSWGQHSFLKEIKAANYGEPYIWDSEYYKREGY